MRYRATAEFMRAFDELGQDDQRYLQLALKGFKDAEKFMRGDSKLTRSSAEVWAVAFGPRGVFTYSFVCEAGVVICVLRAIGQRGEVG